MEEGENEDISFKTQAEIDNMKPMSLNNKSPFSKSQIRKRKPLSFSNAIVPFLLELFISCSFILHCPTLGHAKTLPGKK